MESLKDVVGPTARKDGSSGGDSTLGSWSPIIGIATAIVGNILISVALNVQKYAHIRLSKEQEDSQSRDKRAAASGENRDGSHRGETRTESRSQDQRQSENDPLLPPRPSTDPDFDKLEKPEGHGSQPSYLSSPYWWGGIILMTIGEAGNFLAYGFAPASIVSPLGVVALVSNCIIAPFMLKERFRQRDFWGVLVAVAGAVVVVWSANSKETKLGPGEIWHLISRWQFELYLGITIVLICLGMWLSTDYGEKSIVIDLGLVALFGGYTALSTKGISSLLSYTLWRVLGFPLTYLLAAILVITALFQIKYLNRALQRFDSTQVIPTQFVFFTISVIVGSSILYQDFKSATVARLGKFLGGCVLTFVGVYMITSGRQRHDESSSEYDLERGERTTLAGSADDSDNLSIHSQETAKAFGGDSFAKQDLDKLETSTARRYSSPVSPRTSRAPHSDSSFVPALEITSEDHSDEAVSSTQPSPSPQNPWQDNADPPLRPAPVPYQGQGPDATMSTPAVPAEVSRDNYEARPQTPTTWGEDTSRNLTPIQSSSRKRDLLSKRSVSRILPGPLSSPLSSSLSAVVADSLRRGVKGPVNPQRQGNPSDSSPLRGSSSRLRKTRSSNLAGRALTLQDESPESSASASHADRDGFPVTEASTARSGNSVRARSLSSTLGSFWRNKNNSQTNDGNERDDV